MASVTYINQLHNQGNHKTTKLFLQLCLGIPWSLVYIQYDCLRNLQYHCVDTLGGSEHGGVSDC